MKATFVVGSIHYGDNRTIVTLGMGKVGSSDVGMGRAATLELSGVEAIDVRVPRPGRLVLLTLEAFDDEPPATS